MTQEKLLKAAGLGHEISAREAWKLLGIMAEFFEATEMPIILLHEPFWRGLLAWFRERLVADGMIDENECGLLQVVNEPREVVDAIFDFYEKRGFEPSPAEREVLLNL